MKLSQGWWKVGGSPSHAGTRHLDPWRRPTPPVIRHVAGEDEEDTPHAGQEGGRHQQQQHLGQAGGERELTPHCHSPSSPASASAVSKSIVLMEVALQMSPQVSQVLSEVVGEAR